MNKLVLTGAAGRLGSYLREPLSGLAQELVSTDIVDDLGKLYPREKFVSADLANINEIEPLMYDADMVIHFGAHVDEAPFEKLLGPNFIGAYNIWECARRQNVRRVIYASSIHAVGMYPKTKTLSPSLKHNPDSFYGLGKCFTEDMAKMYFKKNGIESVCLRIASCAPVTTLRSLSTWLSYDDLIQLVINSIQTSYTGFSIIYGVSNNKRKNLDNTKSSYIGFNPKDDAEIFAKEVLNTDLSKELNDKGNNFHGGPFASAKLGESSLNKMKIIDNKKG